ncbi:hypothetical protein TD95_004739 [Thielaviopsis punctulata]|uniref:FAD/NAD(P)-binding domain-containing protein n=1 Tax=Thielaviopsis punctulata TaxID=72032 RepID=A0A0F4ZA40_9PEZI|nr:hypothetical protein TD95_004739 [Thielaviopsis punctulata]
MTRQMSPSIEDRNTVQIGADAVNTAPSGYTVPEVPLGFSRPLRIITIGAGASGINLIRTLRQKLTGPFEHVVYEKNDQIGGTWYENRYPGCRCDVPSMNYQFSWKKNTEWTNLCASAAEIHQYLCDICEEQEMTPLIKLNHRIRNATWNKTAGLWEVTVEHNGNLFVDKANFLIDATGLLNTKKLPDVTGLSTFTGDLIHTAAWPTDFSVSGKRVALIGNGASGVQIMPWLAANAASLHHIIRSPTWILPPRVAMMKMGALAPVISKIELDAQDNFSKAQIQRFKTDQALYDGFSAALENDMNFKFAISLIENSPQEKWAAQKCREFMTSVLGGREELCKALIPQFPLSCKRLTPAPGYLESFHKPTVKLVTQKIVAVEEKGLRMADGELVEVDVIVCATGFETSFRPTFPITGLAGNLQDTWTKEIPKSYMSVGVADMPNFFKFLGPNAPIAHGSVFGLTEHIANYIARAISKAQTQNIRSMMPSTAAVADYFEHVNAFMPRTAWAGSCSSWYKHNETGPVIGLHPGSRLHFEKMLEDFRGEDWVYEYYGQPVGTGRVNRFAYLGNGFTVPEVQMMKAAAAAAGGVAQ